MPTVYPCILNPKTESEAERRLYDAFARELSADWVVFHAVKRIAYHNGRPHDGEADFILAHPQQGVLVLEVKGGGIRFDPTTGSYASTDRQGQDHDIGDPFTQAQKNKYWLLEFVQGRPGWPPYRVAVGHAVAFPDVVIESSHLRPDAPREIILDYTHTLALEHRLLEILNYWRGTDAPPGRDGVRTLENLLGQAATIRNPLVSEQIRIQQQALIQLAEDQCEVLSGLAGCRRAIIHGSAGSGKTMLAVEKAKRLKNEEGLEPVYVCYNEALADYVGQTLGYLRDFNVFSFYRLVRYWGRRAEIAVPEYSSPEAGQGFFESTLPDLMLEALGKIGPQYDALVVDELQDFNQKWWESLFWLLRDPTSGIVYGFGDNAQRIYPAPVSQKLFDGAPGFVEYQLTSNCRNSQPIAEWVNRFYPGARPPRIKGPASRPVEVLTYSDGAQMQGHLRQVLYRLVHAEKVSPAEIAILTPRRYRKSEERLPGPVSELPGLKLGNFQLTGNLTLEPGQILAKSIYSFRGLERSVIIVAEIDNQVPEDHLRRLLYTTLSRAKTHLILLVHTATPESIRSRLRS